MTHGQSIDCPLPCSTTSVAWLAHSSDCLPRCLLEAFTPTPLHLSLGISPLIVWLANWSCDFQWPHSSQDSTQELPLVCFTREQEDRFQRLQDDYCKARLRYLTHQLGCDGFVESQGEKKCNDHGGQQLLGRRFVLSPRMMIRDESVRCNMKRVLMEYLEKRVSEMERELLKEWAEQKEKENLTNVQTKKKKKKSKKSKRSEQMQQQQQKEKHELLLPRPRGETRNLSMGENHANADEFEIHEEITLLNLSQDGLSDEDAHLYETRKEKHETEQDDIVICKSINGIRKDITNTLSLLSSESLHCNHGRKQIQLEDELERVDVYQAYEALYPALESNDTSDPVIVSSRIEYRDRVSDTAIQTSNHNQLPSNPTCTESVLTASADAMNTASLAIVLENVSLKSENEALRRELSASQQHFTEAVQRVQLKAYIAETARDAAVDRVACLERLLKTNLSDRVIRSSK